MPNVADIVPSTTLREEFGQVKSATRVSMVSVSGALVGDILANALNSSDVPQPGEALSTATPYVRCLIREPKIVGREPGGGNWKVMVTSTYEFIRPLSLCDFSIEGGAALGQVETFVDRDGNDITVTFNGTDYHPSVNVLEPTHSTVIDVLEQTAEPDTVVGDWIKRVNSHTWRGGTRRQWLCVTVRYRLVNETADPPEYMFHYEFQRKTGYEDKGWIYTVAYRDSRGFVPDGATYGNGGIVDVEWYDEKDFNSKFPT